VSKIEVANWLLKVMVDRAEPMWIAFDRWEKRIQAVGWRNNVLKNFLSMS